MVAASKDAVIFHRTTHHNWLCKSCVGLLLVFYGSFTTSAVGQQCRLTHFWYLSYEQGGHNFKSRSTAIIDAETYAMFWLCRFLGTMTNISLISSHWPLSRTWTHDEGGGEVPVRKTWNKVLGLVKSREESSPYGRGLSILVNEGVASGHNNLKWIVHFFALD